MNNNSWIIRGEREITFPPALLLGIVNVTPDSFSDGGRYFEPEKALQQALRLEYEGAAVLDIGGESTRPGSEPVGVAQETARVLPVVKSLLERRSNANPNQTPARRPFLPDTANSLGAGTLRQRAVQVAPACGAYISVDTWRAGTAQSVLEAGVDIINDVSGCMFDPGMYEVLAQYRPGYILGHSPALPATMQDAPVYEDVVEEIYKFFSIQIEKLDKAGLPSEYIALDPGIGFGKTLAHNFTILGNLERFNSLGRPLCIGLSRKRMFDYLLNLPDGEARDPVTWGMTGLLAQKQVQMHRVHAVAGAFDALCLATALQGI